MGSRTWPVAAAIAPFFTMAQSLILLTVAQPLMMPLVLTTELSIYGAIGRQARFSEPMVEE